MALVTLEWTHSSSLCLRSLRQKDSIRAGVCRYSFPPVFGGQLFVYTRHPNENRWFSTPRWDFRGRVSTSPLQREATPFSRGSIGHGYHMSTMADDFQCIAESMSRFGLLDILLNLGGHSNGETWWSSVRHDFSHVSLGTSFAPLRGFGGTLQQHFSCTFASLAT